MPGLDTPDPSTVPRLHAYTSVWRLRADAWTSLADVTKRLADALTPTDLRPGSQARIGLYKTELIRPRKPWRTIAEVELATAEPKEGIMINLAEYDALSFDCYGTLIDWEAGIAGVLAPWAKEVGLDLTDEELLLAYAENEAQAERDTPEALYSAILAEAFRRTGDKLGKTVSPEWAEKLGGSVPVWPAFPDSHDALASLAKASTTAARAT